MTTCPNGHKSPDGQPFCGECGEAITEPRSAAHDAPIPDAAATEETQASGGGGAPTTSAPTKWLTVRRNQFIAGGATLVVVLGVVLALALGSGSGSPTGSSDATQSACRRIEAVGNNQFADATSAGPLFNKRERQELQQAGQALRRSNVEGAKSLATTLDNARSDRDFLAAYTDASSWCKSIGTAAPATSPEKSTTAPATSPVGWTPEEERTYLSELINSAGPRLANPNWAPCIVTVTEKFFPTYAAYKAFQASGALTSIPYRNALSTCGSPFG